MSKPQYLWRHLTPKQREGLLAWRKERGNPWHSPPHRPNFGHFRFLISAACFEHRHLIGENPERMEGFSHDLLAVLGLHANQTFAWCVLPNHYHVLIEATDIKSCFTNWGNFMVALPMLGTERMTRAGERFSFALLNAPCGQIGIFGLH